MTLARNPHLTPTGQSKVFGAANIKRAITDNLKGKDYSASGSLAGKNHTHSREVQRRLRQQQKRQGVTDQ